MIFQDNVLRAYLKNVYFITGTALGGKTTVSRLLGKRHNIPVYDMDDHFPGHRALSDSLHQPSMNKVFRDADEFFGRSVEEYRQWLISNSREQLDFMVLDLIILSQNGRILCDCQLTTEEAAAITVPERTVYLLKDELNIAWEYANRPDHQPFNNYIRSATDYEKAQAVCNETLYSLNQPIIKAVKDSEWFWLERDPARTAEETADIIEKHFGW